MAHQIFLSNENGYSLYDWLTNTQVSRRFRDTLFGTLINPFIDEENVEMVDEYIIKNYFFDDADIPIVKKSCLGLASAHLNETLCISLRSANTWAKLQLPLIIEENGQEQIVPVRNVSNPADFNDPIIADFVENIRELVLVETPLQPDQKNIHLGDHHGKAELQRLCDKLKNNPYVIEMRSTDWGGRRFIRTIRTDGTIDIVLHETDRGYALLVQTSGRNYRETKAIAEILEDRYA